MAVFTEKIKGKFVLKTKRSNNAARSENAPRGDLLSQSLKIIGQWLAPAEIGKTGGYGTLNTKPARQVFVERKKTKF